MVEQTDLFSIPQITGADYVNVFYSSKVFPNSPLIGISPSNFATGEVIRIPESELIRRLGKYHEILRERNERGELESRRYQRIATSPPQELYDRLSLAVQKEKDTKKLISYGGRAAISEGCLKHDTLTANVISRRDARKKGVKNWDIMVKSPQYNEESAVGYHSICSQADDYKWGKARPVDEVTPHMAAAILQLEEDFQKPEDERLIKIIEPVGIPYKPFLLSDETVIDVLVRHYLLHEKYFKINKRLLSDPTNLDPLYIDAMKNGFITSEVIPLRKEIYLPIDPRYAQSLDYIQREMRKRLKSAGFEKSVLYVIEFKGTIWETICPNYERDGETIRLVFNKKFPPLVVYRREYGEFDRFNNKNKINPFSVIGEEVSSIDDKTGRTTKTTVMTPGPGMPLDIVKMPIMGHLKEDYRNFIEKHYKGDKKELMFKMGLGRF